MGGERSGLDARDTDHANWCRVAHQGREQHAAKTAYPRDVLDSRIRSFGVSDLYDLAGLRRLNRLEISERPRERSFQNFIYGGRGEGVRRPLSAAVAQAKQRRRETAHQT